MDNFPYIFPYFFFFMEHRHAIQINTMWQHYDTVILLSVKNKTKNKGNVKKGIHGGGTA